MVAKNLSGSNPFLSDSRYGVGVIEEGNTSIIAHMAEAGFPIQNPRLPISQIIR